MEQSINAMYISNMYEAIDKYGLLSKEALEASQILDIAVVEVQEKIYNDYILRQE